MIEIIKIIFIIIGIIMLIGFIIMAIRETFIDDWD
jgi:hypothetical protein